MYGTLWQVTKFTFKYLGKNTPSSHFTRSGIIASILNRWSSPNVLITVNRWRTHLSAWLLSFDGGDISCKILSFIHSTVLLKNSKTKNKFVISVFRRTVIQKLFRRDINALQILLLFTWTAVSQRRTCESAPSGDDCRRSLTDDVCPMQTHTKTHSRAKLARTHILAQHTHTPNILTHTHTHT